MHQTSFNSIINFNRYTAGTAVDSQGALVIIDPNQPRFDYDPTTLEPKGFLVESQSTNLILNSSSFNTSPWVNSNASVVQEPNTELGSVLSCFRLSDNSTNSEHSLSQVLALEQGKVYSVSVFVKQNTKQYISLSVNDGALKKVFFNLTNGTASISAGVSYGLSISFKSNWYRCTFAFTAESTSCTAKVALANSSSTDSYLGDSNGSVLIQGFQIEQSKHMSSYIPTSTQQVTRTEDSAYLSNPMNWYSSGVGTLFVEGTSAYAGTDNTAGECMVSIADPVRTNFVNVNKSIDGLVNIQSIRNGTDVYDSKSMDWLGDSTKRVAYAFGSAGYKVYVNTLLQVKSEDLTPSTEVLSSAFNSSNFGGWIRKIKFYPFELDDKQLKEITS